MSEKGNLSFLDRDIREVMHLIMNFQDDDRSHNDPRYQSYNPLQPHDQIHPDGRFHPDDQFRINV